MGTKPKGLPCAFLGCLLCGEVVDPLPQDLKLDKGWKTYRCCCEQIVVAAQSGLCEICVLRPFYTLVSGSGLQVLKIHEWHNEASGRCPSMRAPCMVCYEIHDQHTPSLLKLHTSCPTHQHHPPPKTRLRDPKDPLLEDANKMSTKGLI